MRQRQKPFREHILNRMRGTLKRCIRAHSEVYLPQVSEAPKYFEGGGEKKGEKNKAKNKIFPPHTYTHPQLSPLASDKIDKVVGFHDATRLATLHNSAIHFFKQKNRSFLPHQPGRPFSTIVSFEGPGAPASYFAFQDSLHSRGWKQTGH